MDEQTGKTCAACGAKLEEGQAFCPACGAPVNTAAPEPAAPAEEPRPLVCSNCGAELQEGQQFCTKCGQKADSGAEHAAPAEDGIKIGGRTFKKPVVFGAAAAVVVIIIAIIIIASNSGHKSFTKQFSGVASNSWCSISSDGQSMTIDTNPLDQDDYTDTTAYYMVKTVNSELGFSDSLFEKMGETRAIDGRQSEENKNYEVSWSYDPDNGLEVLYEIKK